MPQPHTSLLIDLFSYIKSWQANRPADVTGMTISAVSPDGHITVSGATIPPGDYRLHFLHVSDPADANNIIKFQPIFVRSAGGSTIQLLHAMILGKPILPGYTASLVAGPLKTAATYYNTIDTIAATDSYVLQIAQGDESFTRVPGRVDTSMLQSRVRQSDVSVILGLSRLVQSKAARNLYGGLEGVVHQLIELLYTYSQEQCGTTVGSEISVEYYLEDDQGQGAGTSSKETEYALIDADIFLT